MQRKRKRDACSPTPPRGKLPRCRRALRAVSWILEHCNLCFLPGVPRLDPCHRCFKGENYLIDEKKNIKNLSHLFLLRALMIYSVLTHANSLCSRPPKLSPSLVKVLLLGAIQKYSFWVNTDVWLYCLFLWASEKFCEKNHLLRDYQLRW